MSFRQDLADICEKHGIPNAQQVANETIDKTLDHMRRNADALAEDIAEIGRRFQAGNPPTEAEIIEMAKAAARRP